MHETDKSKWKHILVIREGQTKSNFYVQCGDVNEKDFETILNTAKKFGECVVAKGETPKGITLTPTHLYMMLNVEGIK